MVGQDYKIEIFADTTLLLGFGCTEMAENDQYENAITGELGKSADDIDSVFSHFDCSMPIKIDDPEKWEDFRNIVLGKTTSPRSSTPIFIVAVTKTSPKGGTVKYQYPDVKFGTIAGNSGARGAASTGTIPFKASEKLSM
jgi:hypothetical protein